MMSEKIEGTVVLDGLIEGRVPDTDDAQVSLRQWVSFAGSLGLRFNLEIDGSALSLLADNRPLRADDLRGSPSKLIADTLGQLLKTFPAEERPHLFSTLRSIEYRRGLEVRTLYVVAPNGTIDVRQETVEAATTPPPQPMSRRQKARLAIIGLGTALAVFALSALFVDYRAVVSNLADALRPFDAEKVDVDAQVFRKYFKIEEKAAGRGGRTMVITLQRAKAFPATEADLTRTAGDTGSSVTALLAFEAVARGYVRCEFFGKEGDFLGFAFERIQGLRQQETIDLVLALPQGERPTRIVITY